MNSQTKKFLIESHDAEGKLVERHIKEIEDNPAYGDVECELVMSNLPHVHSVSILEPQLDENDEPKIMRDAKGRPQLDGEGKERPLYIERMRYTRLLPDREAGKEYSKEMEDWPLPILH